MGILESLMSFLDFGNHNLATVVTVALFPGSPRMQNMYRRESLVSILCEYDVIKLGLTQKGNSLHVVQTTMRSTLGVYGIQPPITRYMQ